MIYLASKSEIRLKLLRDAGLNVMSVDTRFDEEAEKAQIGMLEPQALAARLAAGKAHGAVSVPPDGLVIGVDQVLACEGVIFSKAGDIDKARRQLLALRGKTHELHTAVSCHRSGAALWSSAQLASLTMRTFSKAFADSYLESEGPSVLASVGCYKLEGRGVQLFDLVEGDYFAILGLPLLPLLAFLRQTGELPS